MKMMINVLYIHLINFETKAQSRFNSLLLNPFLKKGSDRSKLFLNKVEKSQKGINHTFAFNHLIFLFFGLLYGTSNLILKILNLNANIKNIHILILIGISWAVAQVSLFQGKKRVEFTNSYKLKNSQMKKRDLIRVLVFIILTYLYCFGSIFINI